MQAAAEARRKKKKQEAADADNERDDDGGGGAKSEGGKRRGKKAFFADESGDGAVTVSIKGKVRCTFCCSCSTRVRLWTELKTAVILFVTHD
jgi:hypothetical protein